MKLKTAREIIESEFGDLKKEDRSQYDTLVSLLVNYGADESRPVEKRVSQEACGHWQKGKPKKECYFVYRDNKKDNYPSLYEAKLDDNILCVFNIQDDEFIYTMEEMADGEFFIIEK